MLLASAAPAALLAVAGVLIARSISPDATGPLAGDDFVPLFLLASLLAVLLAVLLAAWIDIGIRSQLRTLFRALRTARAPELRGLATGDAWGAIGQLAEEAQVVLGRVEEGTKSTAELAEIQRSADELIEQIQRWEGTEDAPRFTTQGALAGLAEPLERLATRLRARDREALEAADLTRESAAEARARMDRARKETERATVEVSALMNNLREVRHIAAALAPQLHERARQELDRAESSGAADEENRDRLRRNLELAQHLSSALSGRFQDMERRATRAALQQAAGRLLLARWATERGEAAALGEEIPLLEVDDLREIATQSHEGAGSFDRLGEYLEEALDSVARESAPESATETGASTGIQIDLCERLEHAVTDAQAKGERLAALAERASRHAVEAASASDAALQDLRGLASRFEPGQATPPGGAGGTSSVGRNPEPAKEDPAGADPPAWEKRSTPLRLLTREDVLPDEEPAAAEDEAPRAPESDDPPGKGVGDV
jgi:hypothetical protein